MRQRQRQGWSRLKLWQRMLVCVLASLSLPLAGMALGWTQDCSARGLPLSDGCGMATFVGMVTGAIACPFVLLVGLIIVQLQWKRQTKRERPELSAEKPETVLPGGTVMPLWGRVSVVAVATVMGFLLADILLRQNLPLCAAQFAREDCLWAQGMARWKSIEIAFGVMVLGLVWMVWGVARASRSEGDVLRD